MEELKKDGRDGYETALYRLYKLCMLILRYGSTEPIAP